MSTLSDKLTSVDEILVYLRGPLPPEVAPSSTTLSTVDPPETNARPKPSKRRKKEKESFKNLDETTSEDVVQKLSSGRVRYGPITVNPRTIPAKTLFTGRRSKYERLPSDEEEKRRVRREKNRKAATKCREKRELVFDNLKALVQSEELKYKELTQTVTNLQERKQHLQDALVNHINSTHSQSTDSHFTAIFDNENILPPSYETSTPPLLLPSNQLQSVQEIPEESNHVVESTGSLLINTGYNTDPFDPLLNYEQSTQYTISMNSSSLERLLTGLQPLAPVIDNNNNDCSALFNSAHGSSSCTKQNSSSSEDDSLQSSRKNHFVR